MDNIRPTKSKSLLERIAEETETHNMSDTKVQMCALHWEMAHMKKEMKNHQRSTYHAVKRLQIELDNKTEHFIFHTQSLRSEIDNIQVKCQAETINHNLHGTASMQLELGYKSQLNDIKEQIKEVNKNAEQIEEAVNDLCIAIESFKPKKTSTNEENGAGAESVRIDDITNAIECLKSEINRIKSSIFIDDEKIIRMNEQMTDVSTKYADFNRRVNNSLVELCHTKNSVKDFMHIDEVEIAQITKQLHVLSSKYIDFSIKMTENLIEFSRMNNQRIQTKEIIDPSTANGLKNDTKLENASIKSDQSTRSATIIEENGKYLNGKSAPHCFTIPVDPNEYSRFVDVEIRDVIIHDFKRLVDEFTIKLEAHIGKGFVRSAKIRSYHSKNNIATLVSIIVELREPVNSQFFDNFTFPANWFFSLQEKRTARRPDSKRENF